MSPSCSRLFAFFGNVIGYVAGAADTVVHSPLACLPQHRPRSRPSTLRCRHILRPASISVTSFVALSLFIHFSDSANVLSRDKRVSQLPSLSVVSPAAPKSILKCAFSESISGDDPDELPGSGHYVGRCSSSSSTPSRLPDEFSSTGCVGYWRVHEYSFPDGKVTNPYSSDGGLLRKKVYMKNQISKKDGTFLGIYGTSKKNAKLRHLTQDVAATKIQCAYRAYKARKGLRRLKGIVKFRGALEEGHSVKNQAASALNHIHLWSRVQAEIKARWLGMVLDSRNRQKKLENQLKLDAKLHELEWRASSNQYFGQSYYDISKESWGWSWKERWIAARPWENRALKPSLVKKVETKHKTSESVSKAVKKASTDGKASAHARKASGVSKLAVA
ncbi:IQ-domain 10 [Striga asiatica]|uniref:IQ-domain 10 n=1 Tax=Striga asiatica TaxID=4170 RepID=A0A5A7P8T6_STRAF|nr:IQ-domain 10 [Striga asiatica]